MAKGESDWYAKARFMREVNALDATWSVQALGLDEEPVEVMTSLKLAPQTTRPAQPAPATGPAAKTAAAFAERLRREHETRFAASHYKPRLDIPKTEDDVPRAVRARSASDGGTSNKPKRR